MNLRNITRMEYQPPFGWMVRIQYGRKTYRKFFNDKKYGGKNLSLLAAVAWRDELKKKNGIPNTTMNAVGWANSNTGVVGVSLSKDKRQYIVSWVDANGRPNRASVSIRKYGKEKAFERACRIRKKMEEWRLNGNVLPDSKKRDQRARDMRKYTKEELIEYLRKMAAIVNRVPTSRDFKKTRPNYHKFTKTFGSWNAAIAAAGLRKENFNPDKSLQGNANPDLQAKEKGASEINIQ